MATAWRRRLATFASLAAVSVGVGPAIAAPQASDDQGSARPAAVGTAGSAAVDRGRPLVIVLDTSGSMSEDDGTGTIKLAGAQAALSRVIREQRPGSQIGLWTYPDGSCEPGGFRIAVQDLDQRSMISTIRGLEADGDTPTGEALRATVDELTANGYVGATILLISDGLHTCDADPCTVAQEVVAEGFDLTVQAAGFQIDDEGAEELACIAGATGGNVFDASNAEDLTEVVADAARAELTMKVSGLPSRTPAGSASRVTVQVTNESAVDVTDARIAFSFGGTFNEGVIPAVLPPLLRLGRVAAGESTSRSWVVSYGSKGKTGTASYRIAAWGSNAQPRTATGTVTVTDEDLTFDDAGGYIAELRGQRIAILGDSYSSGEGAGDYMKGTDDQRLFFTRNRCHKSPNTYMYPLFEPQDVELIACSGATTHHIGDDPASGVREEQVPLLEERQRKGGAVDAVFMTIGGNDITFGPIIATCISFGDCSDDTSFKDRISRLVNGLGKELEPTYRDVYETLNDREAVRERGHLAPLYVLPYPQPFPERQWAGSFCPGFESDEIEWANGLVDSLNTEIEKSVGAARRMGYHVRFVSTVQEAFLPDNTACPRPGAKAYLNPINLDSAAGAAIGYGVQGDNRLQEFVHPNTDGYRVETNVILAWSVDEDQSLPEGVEEWRPTDGDGLLDLDFSAIARVATPTLPQASLISFDASTGDFTQDSSDVRAGQSVEVQVDNAMPSSTVTVSIASRSRVVGILVVDADGTGRGTVRIPPKVSMGTHHLSVLVVNEDGRAMSATHELDVARAIPFRAVPIAAGTLLCLLGWLLCRLWNRRLTRRLPAN